LCDFFTNSSGADFSYIFSRGISWKNDFSKLFPRKIPFLLTFFGEKFSAEFSPKFSPEKMYEKSAPGHPVWESWRQKIARVSFDSFSPTKTLAWRSTNVPRKPFKAGRPDEFFFKYRPKYSDSRFRSKLKQNFFSRKYAAQKISAFL
jgi:hypothetical protein